MWLAGRLRAPYRGHMAGDPHLELRVSRLENDSTAMYELISEIQSTQQEHSRRFDTMDGHFESIDGGFESIDRRFDSVEATLAEVVRRLPEPS